MKEENNLHKWFISVVYDYAENTQFWRADLVPIQCYKFSVLISMLTGIMKLLKNLHSDHECQSFTMKY